MRPAAATLALAVLLLAGCTAGSGASDAAGSGAMVGSGESAAGGGGSDAAADGTAAGAGAVPGEVGLVSDAARQVVTEGSVTLTVDQPRRAAGDAAALVEGAGGHVQERSEQAATEGEQASARLVVRIPSDGLTHVLAELERLGTVDDVQLSSTDVTGQAQDLDARIRALQISTTRLEDLLARAQSTADVVAAEQTLTQRQSELEAMVSQRNRLADQVDLSTITLQFWTPDAVPAVQPAGFWGGLATGWQSLVTALSTGLLVLGVLLPWAAVGGVVLTLWVAARRSLRRRRPAAAAGTDPSAA